MGFFSRVQQFTNRILAALTGEPEPDQPLPDVAGEPVYDNGPIYGADQEQTDREYWDSVYAGQQEEVYEPPPGTVSLTGAQMLQDMEDNPQGYPPNSDIPYARDPWQRLVDEMDETGVYVYGDAWPQYRDRAYQALVEGWGTVDINPLDRNDARHRYAFIMEWPADDELRQFDWEAWKEFYYGL